MGLLLAIAFLLAILVPEVNFMPIRMRDDVMRHSATLDQYEYDPVLGVVTIPAGKDSGTSNGFDPHKAGPLNVVTTKNEVFYFDPRTITDRDIRATMLQSDDPEDTYRVLGNRNSPLAPPRLVNTTDTGVREGLDGLRLQLRDQPRGDTMDQQMFRKMAQELGVSEQELYDLSRRQQSVPQPPSQQHIQPSLPPIQSLNHGQHNYQPAQQSQPQPQQQQPSYGQNNYQPAQQSQPQPHNYQPNYPPNPPQQQGTVGREVLAGIHMGRGDVAPTVSGVEDLRIPFLSSSGPTPPQRVVVVNGGALGKFSVDFHDVIERPNHIILVRDTRHVGSVSWLPPEAGETPLQLSVQQETGDYVDYLVLSLGYDFRFGVFDMVFLPIYREMPSQTPMEVL